MNEYGLAKYNHELINYIFSEFSYTGVGKSDNFLPDIGFTKATIIFFENESSC